jgi:hypothetical protein
MTVLNLNSSLLVVALLAGCATNPPEQTKVEHKGKTTIIHHRSLTARGARDRIEAISGDGIVSQSVVEVFDIGRLPDGQGGMHEAHRYYRVAESPHFNLNLPQKSSISARGPKTVFTPPNYSPAPQDQRIGDAVAEAKEAKQKLVQAESDVQKRLQADNSLRGELQDQIELNQRLQDQLNAGFSTPNHQKSSAPSDAEKAAQSATSDLQKWGAQQQAGAQQ